MIRQRISPFVVPYLLACFILLISSAASATFNIEISGVDEEAEKNIRLFFSRWETLPNPKNSQTSKRIHDLVHRALQPVGYYQSRTEYQIDKSTLRLTIQPGPYIVWNQIHVDIVPENTITHPDINNLINSPPFIKGQKIHHQLYEAYKKNLLGEFKKKGYLDATLRKNELNIHLQNKTADVELQLFSGERYRIEQINVKGSRLSARTTNTLIGIKSEEHPWYDSDNIGQMYDSLLSSGYFKHTQIDTLQSPPNHATLNVELTDNPNNRITTGVGYGTDTGVRGKLGWSKPMVNSRGDSFTSLINVSQIGEELTAEYLMPWPHPQERYLKWNTGWKREITTDKETSLLSTGLSFNRAKLKQWQDSYGLNLEKERYKQGDNSTEEITYLYPNFNYLRRIEAHPDWLYNGTLWVWSASGVGVGIFDQETLFFNAEIGLDYALDFTPNHSGIVRIDMGGIATTDFYAVPLTKRFYTGGDQTVRGYRYQSLSSEDEDGELIGGQFLNIFSLEYQYRFKPDWKLALFGDTGRAFISSKEPFNSGVGVGLRWQLPVGMVAFDIAKPLDAEKSNPRLHIYMSTKI